MEGLLTLLLFAVLIYLAMRYGTGADVVHGDGGVSDGPVRHDGQMGRGERRGPAGPSDQSLMDPVCGTEVPPGEGYTVARSGREYRLCSRACLDRFEDAAGVDGGVR